MPAFIVLLGTAGRPFFYSLSCGTIISGLLDHLGQEEAAFVGSWVTSMACLISIVLWGPYATSVSSLLSFLLLLNACVFVLLLSCWASLNFAFAHQSLGPLVVYFERLVFGMMPFVSSTLMIAATMGAVGAEHASFYALFWFGWCFVPMMTPRVSFLLPIQQESEVPDLPVDPTSGTLLDQFDCQFTHPLQQQQQQQSPVHSPALAGGPGSPTSSIGARRHGSLTSSSIPEDEQPSDNDDATSEVELLPFATRLPAVPAGSNAQTFSGNQSPNADRRSLLPQAVLPGGGAMLPFINSNAVTALQFFASTTLPAILHLTSYERTWFSLHFVGTTMLVVCIPLVYAFLLAPTDIFWWTGYSSARVAEVANGIVSLLLPLILVAFHALFVAPILEPYLTPTLWPGIAHFFMFLAFASALGALILSTAAGMSRTKLKLKFSSAVTHHQDLRDNPILPIASIHNGGRIAPVTESLLYSLASHFTSPRLLEWLVKIVWLDKWAAPPKLEPDGIRTTSIYLLAFLSTTSTSIALGMTWTTYIFLMIPFAISGSLFLIRYSLVAGAIASVLLFLGWRYFVNSTLLWLGSMLLEEGLTLRDICNMASVMFVCFLILVVLHVSRGEALEDKSSKRRPRTLSAELWSVLDTILSGIANAALVVYALLLFLVERILTTHSLRTGHETYSSLLTVITSGLGILGISRLASRNRISPIAHWFAGVLFVAKIAVLFTDDFRDIMHSLVLTAVLSPLYFYYPFVDAHLNADASAADRIRIQQIQALQSQAQATAAKSPPSSLSSQSTVKHSHKKYASAPVLTIHCIAIFLAFCIVRRSLLYHFIVFITGNRPRLSASWAFVFLFTALACMPLAFWYIGYSERARRACVLVIFLSIFVAATNPDLHTIGSFIPGFENWAKPSPAPASTLGQSLLRPPDESGLPNFPELVHDFFLRTSYHNEAILYHTNRRRLRALRASTGSTVWLKPWSLLFSLISMGILLTQSTGPLTKGFIAILLGAGLGVFFINSAFPTLSVNTQAILAAADRWQMGRDTAVDLAEQVRMLTASQRSARLFVLISFILSAMLLARLWNRISRRAQLKASKGKPPVELRFCSQSIGLVWHYFAILACLVITGMHQAVRDRGLAMAAIAPNVTVIPPFVVLFGLAGALNFIIALSIRIAGDDDDQDVAAKAGHYGAVTQGHTISTSESIVGNIATMICYLCVYLVHILYFDGSDLSVPIFCLVFVLLTPRAPHLGVATASRFGPAFAALSGTLFATTALKLLVPGMIVSFFRKLHHRLASSSSLYLDNNLVGTIDVSSFVDEIHLTWMWRLLNFALLLATVPGLAATLKFEYAYRRLTLSKALLIAPINFFPLVLADMRGSRMLAVASFIGVTYTFLRSNTKSDRRPLRSVH